MRLQYAQEMKRGLSRNPDVFKHDIAFYLDGVSFVHRQNPLQAAARAKSRLGRKKKEGLQFTGKGSKDLAGGPRLHLSVIVTKDQAGSADRGRPITSKFSAFFLYQIRLRSMVFLVK